MSVKYIELDFCSRDHERVSREWYYLLHDLHKAGVVFNVNEGHRTLARQRELVRQKGLWSASNPTGAAAPTVFAPHIRSGNPAHAVDFDNAAGVIAAAKKRGVTLVRTIPTEPWHLEPNATSLAAYARLHRANRAKAVAAAKAAAKAKARAAARKARAKVGAKKLSKAGAAMICSFEGVRLKAYRDSGGILTIGYGHTGADVKPGQTITQARALALFRKDSGWAQAAVRKLGLRLTQGQFDALTSIVFNCGAGILGKDRTLGAALDRKDMKAAARAFGLYVKDARGNTLLGLVRRRAAERKRFEA